MAKEKQTKRAAAWSLVAMGAGFVASLPFQEYTAGRLLAGSFEAGMVGGLADWFAVTALFRHPLGIPIPHTALLPKNRGKITDALVNTVENNLLNKESIASKIAEVRLGGMLLDTAERELRSPQAAAAIDGMLKQLIRKAPLEQLAPVITAEIRKQVTAFDAGPLLTLLARQIEERGYDRIALDYGLNRAEAWLMKPETMYTLGQMGMRAVSGLQVNGLMQFALNAFLGYLNEERLGGMIQQFLLDQVTELQEEGGQRREAILYGLRRQLGELSESERVREGVNTWKNGLMNSWDGEALVLAKMEELRSRILDYMEDGSYVNLHIMPLLEGLLQDLRGSEETMERLNAKIVDIATGIVEANHSRIGKLVRENIEKMDNETLIAMMEDKLGQDLQWIRINGAVTGFVIGVVLTGLRMFLE
ncbi:DUF445 domain-containing protein [Paenibacillus sp. JX-17]|uniref:DUF445 domain-containing protein n=1 Tax=Paenibacillus lacisoli TaxID=3064525 RepID=A0ABT9CC25_9BACL|nr:DUF445 domain-containing protein [Paenibacillus sp. JX-17]MDO7906812.1 DUF445 domain-containing protein [Paenibacillus sp. JX-17]